MNWYSKLEDRILAWRSWRQGLDPENPRVISEVWQFWQTSPWRLSSQYTDNPSSWPTAWKIFDHLSYCDFLRGLGMFYTLSLHPQLRLGQPELQIWYNSQGERLTLVGFQGRLWNWPTFNGSQPVIQVQGLERSACYQPGDFDFLRI